MYRLLDIIMLVTMIPAILIIYVIAYPAKWQERNLIFGIRNRSEFKKDEASVKVDEITKSCRKRAMVLLIISLLIMGLIMLIPDTIIRMVLWTVFVIADLALMSLPYVKGHSEMKSLKAELGIAASKGVSYTDLKGTGSVHALKLSRIIVPNIIAFVFFIATLLNDIGVISLKGIIAGQDQHSEMLLSILAGSFMSVGLILIPVAIMMDRLRNEVISEDSNVNANYNRAKKKNWADMNVLMTWINTGFIIISLSMLFFIDSEWVLPVMTGIYMLLLFAGIILFVSRSIAISRRYAKDTTIEVDDDDNWLLGSFYYNPDDRRLNVEKRVGVGATINIAHPVGKLIMIISALVFIGMFFSLGYIVVLSKTPMTIRIDEGKIICHHMLDDYEIPLTSVEQAELGTGVRDLKLRRNYGFDMDTIQKGDYSVNGENKCTVFLNLDSDCYIVIHADGKTYYINTSSAEETKAVFEQIKTK